MKLKLFSILSVAVVIVMGITGCCACRKGSPQIGKLENTTWELIELNLNPVVNSGITMRFDAEKKMIYGQAPCNNFFGGYSLLEQRHNIQISNIGSTRRACPDGALEQKFTSELHNVVRVKVESDYLMLLSEDDSLIAVMAGVKE